MNLGQTIETVGTGRIAVEQHDRRAPERHEVVTVVRSVEWQVAEVLQHPVTGDAEIN